jgi:RNA polymerase sigma factor (TIGR02999 family)
VGVLVSGSKGAKPSETPSSLTLGAVGVPVSAKHVTRLLIDWRGGNQAALDELLPLVYNELRRLAQARLRQEPRGHTLQATALVHEAYVRLVDLDRLTLSDRTHFFAMAARVMRQVLVDHARRKRSDKRGGDATRITLGGVSAAASSKALDVDVIDLDSALEELAAMDARLARVVEFKFFVGMTLDETAEALQVSHATVERDWALAKAWLFRRLAAGTSAS